MFVWFLPFSIISIFFVFALAGILIACRILWMILRGIWEIIYEIYDAIEHVAIRKALLRQNEGKFLNKWGDRRAEKAKKIFTDEQLIRYYHLHDF